MALSLNIVGNQVHRLTLPLLLVATGSASAQGYLTPPTAPPENPVTAEKAILGKVLFWDEQLSSDGSMACGTCHIPTSGGAESRGGAQTVNPGPDGLFGTADDSFGSPGVLKTSGFGHILPDDSFGLGTQVTGRYAPSTLTAAYFDELFWDGRAASKFYDPLTGQLVISSGGALESQSLGPLVSDVEMADAGWTLTDLSERLGDVRPLALASNLPPDVAAALGTYADYPALFTQAFGTADITPVRIAFALATYQRTLVPDQSPFDEYERGDFNALTTEELRGLTAFNSTAACASCHTPPLFSNGDYHNLALRPSVEDLGRFNSTGDPQDRGKFKTPSLRNVALRQHWFHNGAPQMTELRDTVELYGTGVGGGFDNLDFLLNGLMISQQDVDDVTVFLGALTDPRVAAGTFPFDRPTLRFERSPGSRNPVLMGTGAVAGTSGAAPEAIVAAAPFAGASRFRVGLSSPLGGTVAALRFRLSSPGGLGGPLAVRALGLPMGVLPVTSRVSGGGYATWQFPIPDSPAIVGLALDAQWWVRDPVAPGGVAKSEIIRLTVE